MWVTVDAAIVFCVVFRGYNKRRALDGRKYPLKTIFNRIVDAIERAISHGEE